MFDKFTREKEVEGRKILHCVACKRSTIHNLEAQCLGSWNDNLNNEGGGSRFSMLRCGACDSVCYETSTWNSYELAYDDEGEPYNPETSVQYPAPVSAHFNFNTESTPGKLDDILDEMLYALAGSKMVLATAGLRFAIEFIVNDKNCAGNTLVSKINDLKTKGLIDDDQKDLLHRIRQRGNAGAHQALGMNSGELVAGMSIIEGLLEKLYNGPARHAMTIERAKRLLKANAPKEDDDS